jgi:hypothetical protein
MYATLLPKIQTTLEACDKLNDKVYNYPIKDFPGYPCAYYIPTVFENEFLTNAENLKGYNFKIYIIQEMKKAGNQNAINTILAEAVDQIMAQFDEDWNQGTLDGHRIWWKLNTGDWGFADNEAGRVVFAELNLIVNLMTTN